MEFVAVPEERSVKNRHRFGVDAGSLDQLEVELERLIGLGASVAQEEAFPPDVAARYHNVVLRDPAGNEFCLGGGSMPDGYRSTDVNRSSRVR